jgi:O-antigen ligase
LLLLGASLFVAEAWLWWGGIALLSIAILTAAGRLPRNALSIGTGLFCAWLFADAVFLTPHYSFVGLYRPVVLLAGFAAAAVLDRDAHARLFRAGAAAAMLLVFVGLLQLFLGFWHLDHNSERAAATFVTPNTFATVINLFLLPVLALAASGRGGWKSYWCSLWLFAGLLTTESRGGWIAFTAGVLLIVAYLGTPKSRESLVRWERILAGLLWVLIAYFALKALLHALPGRMLADSFGVAAESLMDRGFSFRLDLAAVALGQIAEHPIAGAGANTFWPLLEMTKPPELDLLGFTFPFAHNDYLQTWLEFGLPGIVLLGAVMAAAAALVLKGWRVDRDDPIPLTCAAAATGFFVHAMGDFPLYVPFPLVIMGMWLGVLAAHGGNARRAVPAQADIGNRPRLFRSPAVLGTATAAALLWLAQPVLAEMAARRALTELGAGRAQDGLYWESVARRLEPRSGQRHWEEGVIWRDQAVASGNRLFAATADELFADGARLDAFDVNNLFARVQLHRQHPQLFARAAPPQEILQWSAQALRLLPYSLAAQTEYARTLAFLGRKEEARKIALAVLARHPESGIARRLAAEIGAS